MYRAIISSGANPNTAFINAKSWLQPPRAPGVLQPPDAHSTFYTDNPPHSHVPQGN